jgi:hypothetical protein
MYGFCGPEGVVEGLMAIRETWEAGDGHGPHTVTFVVADHSSVGDHIHHSVTVGITHIKGGTRWRWCGEGDDPRGAGSSTICDYHTGDRPEGGSREVSLAMAASTVMMNLARIYGQHHDVMIFRLKDGSHF